MSIVNRKNSINLAKIKEKILNIKDSWMLAEDIPDIDFHFCQIFLTSFVNDLNKAADKNYKAVLSVFKGFNFKFYYKENDSDDFAKHILNKILKDSAYGIKMNREIRKYSDQLKKECVKINDKYLKSITNKELANLHNQLDEIHTTLYSWGWLPNAVDMFHNNFTDYLKVYLRKKLPEEKVNSALVSLSTFSEKSILQKEHQSFLRLVKLAQDSIVIPAKAGIQKNKKILDPQAKPEDDERKRIFHTAIQEHLEKYFYLKFLWLGENGVYDEKYYLNEINKFIKSGEDANELLKKEEKIFRHTLKERKELIKRLKINKKMKTVFDVYAEFAVTKAYRRDAQIYWSYKTSFLLKEIARRIKINNKFIRFLTPNEIKTALIKGLSRNFKKEIDERVKLFVYYVEKGKEYFIYGRNASQIEKSLEKEENKEINELSGQTACLGKAKGKVKIINSIADMKKMQKGDILVSIATNPDIVPAMKLAGAIITEQGGITSHAAIVSREMGTPCVIGTKIATKVLKDGDMVEVDANRGIVKILKR